MFQQVVICGKPNSSSVSPGHSVSSKEDKNCPAHLEKKKRGGVSKIPLTRQLK